MSAEAGDSWVYGCSSDPRKMALMRLFMRARRKHGAAEDPAALFSFSRFLIKASVRTLKIAIVTPDHSSVGVVAGAHLGHGWAVHGAGTGRGPYALVQRRL